MKQTYQPSYAVEEADFILDTKITTAEVRTIWSRRLGIRSNNTRRHWRSNIKNHTRSRDSGGHRRYGPTNNSRRIPSLIGGCSGVSRLQVDSVRAGGGSS